MASGAREEGGMSGTGKRRKMDLRACLSAHLSGAAESQLTLPKKFLVLSFPIFITIFGKVLI